MRRTRSRNSLSETRSLVDRVIGPAITHAAGLLRSLSPTRRQQPPQLGVNSDTREPVSNAEVQAESPARDEVMVFTMSGALPATDLIPEMPKASPLLLPAESSSAVSRPIAIHLPPSTFDSGPLTGRPEKTPVLGQKQEDYFGMKNLKATVEDEITALPEAIAIPPPDRPASTPGAFKSTTCQSADASILNDDHSGCVSPVNTPVEKKLEILDSSPTTSDVTTSDDPSTEPNRGNDNSDNYQSDIFSQRELPSNATHEEIRHRFRTRSSQLLSEGWKSPSTDSSASPLDNLDVSLGPSDSEYQRQAQQLSTDDSEISAVRKDFQSMSLIEVCQILPVLPLMLTIPPAPTASCISLRGLRFV
jgi:hypothetical protein